MGEGFTVPMMARIVILLIAALGASTAMPTATADRVTVTWFGAVW